MSTKITPEEIEEFRASMSKGEREAFLASMHTAIMSMSSMYRRAYGVLMDEPAPVEGKGVGDA